MSTIPVPQGDVVSLIVFQNAPPALVAQGATTSIIVFSTAGGGTDGGGTPIWGLIGGTLSDQADLSAALGTKLDDISAGTADAIVTANAGGTLLSRAGYTIATLISHVVARAQHTGTQLASTISDFASAAFAAVTWSTLTGKPSVFTPDTHTHANTDITGLGGAATLNVGTTAGTVAAGDDSRLSDARTPTAHKTSHAIGGSDALAASDIGAQATLVSGTNIKTLNSESLLGSGDIVISAPSINTFFA